MNISKEILESTKWIQEQIEKSGGFCEVGFTFFVHNGEVKRTDYTLTTKVKPK